MYGSLYPWRFHFVAVNPFAVLRDSWHWPPLPFQYVDFLVNVAIYAPLGACGYLALQPKRPRAIVIEPIAFGFFLSFTIEIAQVYAVWRNASLIDVAANTVGVGAGSLLAILLSRFRHRRRVEDGCAAFTLVCWLAYTLFPFVPVLSLSVLAAKLGMFLTPAFHPMTAMSFAVAWYLAGCLLAALPVKRPAVWLAISILLIPAQILIVSRYPSLSQCLGVVVGTILFRALGMRWPLLPALLIGGIVILRALAPFEWQTCAAAFHWIPFASLIESGWDRACLTLLEKLFYYGSAIWAMTFAGLRLAAAVAIAALALGVLEALQVFLPGRTAEITDPLLALLIGVAVEAFRERSYSVYSADAKQSATLYRGKPKT